MIEFQKSNNTNHLSHLLTFLCCINQLRLSFCACALGAARRRVAPPTFCGLLLLLKIAISNGGLEGYAPPVVSEASQCKARALPSAAAHAAKDGHGRCREETTRRAFSHNHAVHQRYIGLSKHRKTAQDISMST